MINCEDDGTSLVQQISEGDEQAFEQLFNGYFEYLHNVAYNRLQSKDAAEDIVQEIFTDLWKNRASLDIHTSMKSYLFQAVKNKVCKFIRHKSVREKEQYIKRIHNEYYLKSPFPNSSEVLEEAELKRLISSHLEDLPEKTQEIFTLSREEHYTHQEIAEKLNCSPKTVEYHIGKVLKHLRIHLNKYTEVVVPLLFFLYN